MWILLAAIFLSLYSNQIEICNAVHKCIIAIFFLHRTVNNSFRRLRWREKVEETMKPRGRRRDRGNTGRERRASRGS